LYRARRKALLLLSTSRTQADGGETSKDIDSLKKAIGATIQVMVSPGARDPYTAGHQIRSAHLACAIAMEMGLAQEKIDGIRMAGSIHTSEKYPYRRRYCPSLKLTDLEFSLIKEHSRSGYEMLKDVESPCRWHKSFTSTMNE